MVSTAPFSGPFRTHACTLSLFWGWNFIAIAFQAGACAQPDGSAMIIENAASGGFRSRVWRLEVQVLTRQVLLFE